MSVGPSQSPPQHKPVRCPPAEIPLAGILETGAWWGIPDKILFACNCKYLLFYYIRYILFSPLSSAQRVVALGCESGRWSVQTDIEHSTGPKSARQIPNPQQLKSAMLSCVTGLRVHSTSIHPTHTSTHTFKHKLWGVSFLLLFNMHYFVVAFNSDIGLHFLYFYYLYIKFKFHNHLTFDTAQKMKMMQFI